ncbi:MAG: histone deacetylase family protein [Thiogranum sp.]|nr:histone deacetylase family protein [Thiogranum sp.]
MTLAFISHNDCTVPYLGEQHPERPERLSAIEDQLIASNLELALRRYDAPLATREQLCRVHSKAYVKRIFSLDPRDEGVWLEPSTLMVRGSLAAARRAAGAAVLGVDLVMKAQARAVFCNVRPPGHHAERDTAMGFCIFNNIAVGAAHALQVYGVERVAIMDFDAHHGNGTESMFRNEPRVLYCSVFQHPFYPFRDIDMTSAQIVAVPLPAEAAGAEFRAAVEAQWLPRLDRFRPQLILVSAGFDAHVEDDLTDLRLVDSDFAWVSKIIFDCAERYADGRIVSTLEGGYALPALGRSVAAHLNALLG